jgi:hypothetical protein
VKRLIAVLGIAVLAGIGVTACDNTTTVNCLDRQAYVVPLDDVQEAVPEKGAAPPAPKPPPPAPKSGTIAGKSNTSGGTTTSTVKTPTTRFTSTAPRTYSSTTARTNYYYTAHFYDNVHYGVSINPYVPLRPYYIGWGYVGPHPFLTYNYLYGWDAGYVAGSMNNQC